MINNPFIHSLSFHCCVQLRMSNAVYTAMVRWKKGDSLIKTYRGPNIGSRLVFATSRYCHRTNLSPRYRFVVPSLHRVISLQYFFTVNTFKHHHTKNANLNSAIMRLWSTKPYVESNINSFLSKICFLIARTLFFQWPQFSSVWKLLFILFFPIFLFCDNCM